VKGGRRALGARGEAVAEAYLRRRGCRLLARNYRSRLGELDLVVLDAGVVVFVEVKTRRGGRAGGGTEAVSPQKRRRLLRLARHFLAAHGLEGSPCRFDVIALAVGAGRARLEVVRDAFREGES
jgi:putative endonuclease